MAVPMLSRITILPFTLTGCGHLVAAWPPSPMMPTMTGPTEHGEIEIGVGVNGMIAAAVWQQGDAGSITFLVVDVVSPFALGGTVGLREGTDLTVTLGPAVQGSTYITQLGQRFWHNERIQLDALGGFGATWSEATGNFETAASYDSDGDGIQNLEIEPERRDYAYWALAPVLGTRATFTPTPQLVVPVYARGSWSFTVPVQGLYDDSMPNQPYWEVGSAAVWRPGKVVELGGGVSLLGGETFAFFRANASVSIRLGAFGPHSPME